MILWTLDRERPDERSVEPWKSAPQPAQLLAPMGLNDHQQALKAAEQRVESLKVSL
jgi:hypothetical protein